MAMAATGVHSEQFMDAVALYSQRLCRSSTASCTKGPEVRLGHAGQSQRLFVNVDGTSPPPRIPPASARDEAPTPTPGPARSTRRIKSSPSSSSGQVRPFSAAAVGRTTGGVFTSRPKSPHRPVTATGSITRASSTCMGVDTGSKGRRFFPVAGRVQSYGHRRVVTVGRAAAQSATSNRDSWAIGGAPLSAFGEKRSKAEGGHRVNTAGCNASGLSLGDNGLDAGEYAGSFRAAAIDGGFWHEHDDLGSNPIIMKETANFVGKIICAKQQETRTIRGVLNDKPLQPEANTAAAAEVSAMSTPSTHRAWHGVDRPLPRKSEVCKRKDHCRPGVQKSIGSRTTKRRKRAYRAATTHGGSNIANFSTVENHRPPATRNRSVSIRTPVRSSRSPSPSGGGGSMHHATKKSAIVYDNLEVEDGCRRGGHQTMEDEVKMKKGDKTSELSADVGEDTTMAKFSILTPLALDTFCSMRPKLCNHNPQLTSTLTGSSAGGDRRGQPGRHVSSQPRDDTSANLARGETATLLKQTRSSQPQHNSHGVPQFCQQWKPGGDDNFRHEESSTAAWTSVFGAVCAGATRGRVRAEVLKEARRASRRRRRSPRLVLHRDCTAVAERALLPADLNSVIDCNERANASIVEGVNSKIIDAEEGNDKIQCDQLAGDALNIRGQEESGPDHGKEHISLSSASMTHADDVLVKHVADKEGHTENNVVRGIDHIAPATSCTPRKHETGSHMQEARQDICRPTQAGEDEPGCSFATDTASATMFCSSLGPSNDCIVDSCVSPLPFRHRCRDCVSRVDVNAPRRLQVSPPSRGFNHVPTIGYSPRRSSRQEASKSTCRSSRRPFSAAGASALAGDDTGRNNDGNSGCSSGRQYRCRVKRERNIRPKTAGAYFHSCFENEHALGRGDKEHISDAMGTATFLTAAHKGLISGPTTIDGKALYRRVTEIAETIASRRLRRYSSSPPSPLHGHSFDRKKTPPQPRAANISLHLKGIEDSSNSSANKDGAEEQIEYNLFGSIDKDSEVMAGNSRMETIEGGDSIHSITNSVGTIDKFDGLTDLEPPFAPSDQLSTNVTDEISAAPARLPRSTLTAAETDRRRRRRRRARSVSAPSRLPAACSRAATLPVGDLVRVESRRTGVAQRAVSSPALLQLFARMWDKQMSIRNVDSLSDSPIVKGEVRALERGPTTCDGSPEGSETLGKTDSLSAIGDDSGGYYDITDVVENRIDFPESCDLVRTASRAHVHDNVTAECNLHRADDQLVRAERIISLDGLDSSNATHPETCNDDATYLKAISARDDRELRLKGVNIPEQLPRVAEGAEIGTMQASIGNTGDGPGERPCRERQKADLPLASAKSFVSAQGKQDPSEADDKAAGGLGSVAGKVDTSLGFQKAMVKIKFMAAKAAVAVDDHERAWSASKEKSEVLFNDCRRAAEEDAQRAGDGVKLETQTRLHRIVTQAGLDETTRIERETTLEELKRVLAQDTRMYASRTHASERMMRELRTLEADNNASDMTLLLENRRRRTLLMLQDRTERDNDQRRSMCARLREEVVVMDTTLEEARHARGLLLGHVQHIIEMMSTMVEHVALSRTWCQGRLEERRYARGTSKALNANFRRTHEELGVRLSTRRPSLSSERRATKKFEKAKRKNRHQGRGRSMTCGDDASAYCATPKIDPIKSGEQNVSNCGGDSASVCNATARLVVNRNDRRDAPSKCRDACSDGRQGSSVACVRNGVNSAAAHEALREASTRLRGGLLELVCSTVFVAPGELGLQR